MTRVSWTLAAAIALTGCSILNDEFSFETMDASVDGSLDAGPSDDANPSSCTGTTSRCGPSVPSGWSGPIVLVTGAGDGEAPPCPSTAPTSEFTARSDLMAAPAECGCTCADPDASVMDCSDVSISPSCTLITSAIVVPAGGCTDHASTSSDAPWRVSESTFMALGGCDPEPTISIPSPTWGASHRACSFGEPEACGDGVCTPPLGEEDRLCVFTDGDVSTCPPDFPFELITAEGIDDGRGCSTCECGPLEGTCDGHVQRVSRCMPPNLLYDSIPLGTCAMTLGPQDAMGIAGVFSPTGSCAPRPVTPIGDATLASVRTVCCAAP